MYEGLSNLVCNRTTKWRLLYWLGRISPHEIDLDYAAEALETSDLVLAIWATVVLSDADHPVLEREIAIVSGIGSYLGSDCSGIRMNFDVRQTRLLKRLERQPASDILPVMT